MNWHRKACAYLDAVQMQQIKKSHTILTYKLVQWWRNLNTNTWSLVPNKPTRTWIRWLRKWYSITSLCVTNEKYMALQQQIWSTFVTVLWCSKSKITDGTGILVLVRVLWDMISKIFWQFWHSFFKNALENCYNFNPIEITWRKMVRSVCLKPVSMATWRLHNDVSLYQHI